MNPRLKIHVFFSSRKYRGRNMVPCGSALEAAERESRSSFDHTAELQIPSNDRLRLENMEFAIWKSWYVHYF